jgi:transcriptional regulator with XRE-family HTH domain
VSLGALIRDLRVARGWSQGGLAAKLCDTSGRPSLTREEISRWERGKIIPGPYWIGHLASTLEVSAGLLTEEARIERVNRRAFIGLAALSVTHGKLAAEMIATVAASDPGPLTTVQTTHGTDLVIAALTDRSARRCLDKWMTSGDNPVLRVNSAGILAKLPGQDAADRVADVLADDWATRRLYTTAVLARTCALEWGDAARIAGNPRSLAPRKAQFIASRLASEVLNPRDAGARWCSAAVLGDLAPIAC